MSYLEKDMSYKAVIKDLDESFRSKVAINNATRPLEVNGKRYKAIDLGAKDVLPAADPHPTKDGSRKPKLEDFFKV